ncbi:MAG: EamA family transporter, partial [Clostridiales bacterium]|nr:EamA family transporter [Clostridiales bacterium]
IYVVPKKISKQKPITYAMIMGAGYFIASAIGYIILKMFQFIDEPLFFPHVIIACLNGIVWAIASVSVLSSIDRIGLAKSNQWKSLQGPIGAFLMMTFLSEFLTTKVYYIILAMVFITLAAMLFSTRDKDNTPVDKTGIVHALVAAFFYGISSLLSKVLTSEGTLFAQQIFKALFVFLSAAVYILVKDKSLTRRTLKTKKEILLPLLGGVLFFGNASFYLLAYRCLEGSIVMLLHQLNAIWLLLLGVFVFKEINFKKHWLRLVAGLVLSLIGLLMLILAKA